MDEMVVAFRDLHGAIEKEKKRRSGVEILRFDSWEVKQKFSSEGESLRGTRHI